MGKQSPLNRILAVFLILTCAFLSACEQVVAGPPATITPIPTCISSTPNPYESHPQSDADTIYREYYEGRIGLEQARKEAFLRLAENAEHWSAYRDLARDDNRMIRITLTLIDPALIQYIVLNHALTNAANNSFIMNTTQFQDTVTYVMNLFGAREELLFLVTITSPTYVNQPYGPQLLMAHIPFEEMVLISASDMRISSSHDDHNLNEEISTTNGPVFGYIAFPLSVMQAGACVFIMDYWNTTLTLEVPSAQFGDKVFDTLSWTLPYNRIVTQSTQHPPTVFYSFEKYVLVSTDTISPRTAPPTPIWSPNSGSDPTIWQAYWQEMGQYFWHLIMTESHH